jgi:hypothetical protein
VTVGTAPELRPRAAPPTGRCHLWIATPAPSGVQGDPGGSSRTGPPLVPRVSPSRRDAPVGNGHATRRRSRRGDGPLGGGRP